MGDFKFGVSAGVYSTKCTLNFEITHCTCTYIEGHVSVLYWHELKPLKEPILWISTDEKPNFLTHFANGKMKIVSDTFSLTNRFWYRLGWAWIRIDCTNCTRSMKIFFYWNSFLISSVFITGIVWCPMHSWYRACRDGPSLLTNSQTPCFRDEWQEFSLNFLVVRINWWQVLEAMSPLPLVIFLTMSDACVCGTLFPPYVGLLWVGLPKLHEAVQTGLSFMPLLRQEHGIQRLIHQSCPVTPQVWLVCSGWWKPTVRSCRCVILHAVLDHTISRSDKGAQA
jgi:hypothetical protein